MSRLTIIIAVFTIAMTSNQVIAKSFIKRALENLQKHQDDQILQTQNKYQQRDDSDDEDNLSSLSLQGFGNFLGLALPADYDDGNQKLANRKKTHQHRQSNKKKLGQFNKLNLDNVLLYDPNRAVYTETKKQPLLELLGASNNAKTTSDFNDNAQVYIILDEDVLKSESENSLDDLISTLIKSSSSQKDRSDGRAEHRYQGFQMRDSYRKARGDSSDEKYASEDDDSPRPVKRPRAYVGKGRTAIPYIRNRGDIYEKDY